jgi:hypothetical protein
VSDIDLFTDCAEDRVSVARMASVIVVFSDIDATTLGVVEALALTVPDHEEPEVDPSKYEPNEDPISNKAASHQIVKPTGIVV